MIINIKGTNLELTPALRRYAEEKVVALTKFFSDLTQARIELERTTKRHHKGKVWRAEANLLGPRHLFRAEAVGSDIYTAIDSLKDELKRELRAYKEKNMSSARRLSKKTGALLNDVTT